MKRNGKVGKQESRKAGKQESRKAGKQESRRREHCEIGIYISVIGSFCLEP